MCFAADRLHSRAESLAARFQDGGGRSYIDHAIVLSRKALELCPPGHPKRHVSLSWLALHLGKRYDQLGVMEDLNEAIALDRDALALRPPGHQDHLDSLNGLTIRLSTRYNELGVAEDLNEAIVLARDALVLCPAGHPDHSMALNNLANHLSTRYNELGVKEDFNDQFGAMEDLNEAVDLARDALALWPPGHADHSIALNNLANHLSTRYMLLGGIEDLNEAIVLARDALAVRPPGYPGRSIFLDNLANNLSTRYNELEAMEDLNEAIVLARDALVLCPVGHPDRSSSLNNLVNHLSTRYHQLGTMEDLNEAIVLARDALTLCPLGHADHSKALNNLANNLSTRYMQLGAMEDFNEALVLARDVLALSPPGHAYHSMALNNLANHLSTRYMQLGRMEDLNKAIVLARDALALRPPGHPGRSISLDTLASNLSIRYHQLGAIEDLNEAIVLARDALALRPAGHPDRSSSFNNLSNHVSTRYHQFGVMEDLNEAIVFARDALALWPPGHPDRSMSLDNLAIHLSTQYHQLGAVEDLNEAIVLARNALALRPPGHPGRSTSLDTLAIHLYTRFNQLGAMEDLNEAIILDREALALCPPGHPDRSMSLSNLAGYLHTRFTQSSQSLDKEELFNIYAQLADSPSMVSSTTLSAARAWIAVAEDFHHPTTLLAYQTALRLLTHHVATLPPLPQHRTVLKNLTSSLAVDAFSACLRSRSPKDAVVLLEQGRGVFWSQLTRLRSPLDDVIASGSIGKMLADEFTQKTLLIRTALNSSGPDQHDRVCRLNIELQGTITRIRTELPGLSHFLLPPLFSDLQQAACKGPVIIVNASKYGCDALVVLVDRNPHHIPLSITQDGVRALSSKLATLSVRTLSMDVTEDLTTVLRELWDKVVSPIVDFLQTVHPLHSRIWWCPTSEFSLLPLHAAGPHKEGQQNLANLYISSYTPTLTALIRARRHDSVSKGTHFLGIGQANAEGENEIVSVGCELADIGQRVDGLTTTTFTHIEGEDSCIIRVGEELGKNEWVHFACHGIPNQEQPFESAFALHDGHFTIERIIQSELRNAQFAFLSACQTTVGDEESADEVMHLASAMQFAGFRSVIGTMWAVMDVVAPMIASAFYDNMIDECGCLDYTRAAFALNKTIEESVDIPFDQRFLYIHIGA